MRTKEFLLDTNIIIYYIKGEYDLDFNSNRYYISRISYIELLSFDKLDLRRIDYIKKFVDEYLHIIELDLEISNNSATLGRSIRDLKIADSIILASAFTYDLELLTKDKKLNNYYDKIIL